MKALLLLLVFAATPASAETWIDVECKLLLKSGADGFVYESLEIGDSTHCEIARGPEESLLVCDNGWKLPAVFDETSVIINGVQMNVYAGPIPCGSNGAEWPD